MLARTGRIGLAALAIAACGLDAVGAGTPATTPVAEDAGPLIPGDSGYVPPPEAAPPDGNCGDVLSSSQQCGECGHSCGGSSCSNGVCEPEPVFGISDPQAIGLGPKDVFVASSGNIRQIPFGGAPIEIPGTAGALSIAVADPAIFFVTQNTVQMRSPAESASFGSSSGRDLAFGADRIFVSRQTGDVVSRGSNLVASSERLHATAGGDPFGVAVDDTSVFWVDRTAKAIVRALHTGTGAPLIPNQDGLSSLAVDGFFLYWATSTEIHRSSKNGGDQKVLASGLKEPRSLVVNKTMLYWIDAPAGELKRVPITGGTPLVLARFQALPAETSARLIAVNDTHVYWLSPNENTLKRLPR